MKKHFPPDIFRFILLLALNGLLGACASVPPDSLYRGPFPRPDWVRNEFRDSTVWIASQQIKENYQEITLIPQNQENPGQTPIIMDFFRAAGDSPQPAILVSPILGGKNREATHFALYLSLRGYHCLVVHRPKDLTQDLKELQQLDDRLRQAVIRDRAALDWLCAQPFVDKNAIGAFGISYGGIKNTVLAGVDERIKASVIALAGADMASIVSHSNHKVLKRLRDYLRENGATGDADIEREIRDVIRTEPLRFAPFVDPKATLLILARGDRTVPRANGELLRQALGCPRTLYIPSGHYSAAFFTGMFGLPYVESITKEFFDRRLKSESGFPGCKDTQDNKKTTPPKPLSCSS